MVRGGLVRVWDRVGVGEEGGEIEESDEGLRCLIVAILVEDWDLSGVV